MLGTLGMLGIITEQLLHLLLCAGLCVANTFMLVSPGPLPFLCPVRKDQCNGRLSMIRKRQFGELLGYACLVPANATWIMNACDYCLIGLHVHIMDRGVSTLITAMKVPRGFVLSPPTIMWCQLVILNAFLSRSRWCYLIQNLPVPPKLLCKRHSVE